MAIPTNGRKVPLISYPFLFYFIEKCLFLPWITLFWNFQTLFLLELGHHRLYKKEREKKRFKEKGKWDPCTVEREREREGFIYGVIFANKVIEIGAHYKNIGREYACALDLINLVGIWLARLV